MALVQYKYLYLGTLELPGCLLSRARAHTLSSSVAFPLEDAATKFCLEVAYALHPFNR